MPVKINNIPVVPAPVATFSKSYISNQGVGVIGAEYSVTLVGDLIAYKGNPVSSGTTPTVGNSSSSVYTTYSSADDPINNLSEQALLNSIMKKQESLRALVSANLSSNSPLLLEIVGYNEDKGIKAYCDVISIDFGDKSRWTQTCDYTISLKIGQFIESANGIFSANKTEDNFTYAVSEADESWTLEENDYTAISSSFTSQVKTYTISHTVSAVGRRTFVSGVLVSPISQAIGFVNNAIGLGSPTSFTYLPGGLTAYNQQITENKNEFAGSYSATETFYMSPASAKEFCAISVEEDSSAFVRVSINGTITGLDTSGYSGSESDKYENAEAYWDTIEPDLYTRCDGFIDCTLNTVALNKSVGRNFTEGTINYNYSYDNRPANAIAGAKTEDIQINDTYPGQLINVVPVIGRSQPIIQYVNSRSEYKRSLQISAVMGGSGCSLVKPSASDLTTIFNLYKPSGTKVYYSAPQENWNPRTGNYSYNIDWTYEV